ncbi:MAG TPA: serine hydrolase domain-containing protein [Chthoniobacterales bacterium]|nr:serine hydrolase domain-containing protein [Chthoniobacterales bacterium]
MKNKVVPLFLILLASLTTAFGQGPAPSPLLSPAPVLQPAAPLPELALAHDLTKADLEAFLDALIPAQLQNRDMAGAVISVVKDGQVLLAKGYGYADFAARKPVVADATLFRPGSISKVFTATAVMQLVEQGKVDLDRDVNDYLDFAIPRTYPEPVTLRRILTHTAGFEETLKNLFVPSARNMRPLRDYLVAAMPARIFPPGTVPSYSNYGLTIAGYIVERVSGEPFDKYIAAHILTPLRMEHSSFAQPLPEILEPDMSRGYLAATQGPRGFEFVTTSPAGALSATATDMTRLMLAFLGEGTLEGATILKPESVRAMEARQFELHPALHAIGLILIDYSMNGQRIVGHGGDTIYFHSDMMLMPDAHIGLFISYNSAGSRSGGGRTEVIRAFLNRYFPEPVTASPAIDLKTAQADGRAVSGLYTGSRRADSTLLKVAALLGQTSVSSDQNGVLTIEGVQGPRGGLKQWREIGPLVYREVDGADVIAFRRNANGVVTDMLPAAPIQIGQRVTGFANKKLLLPALGISLGLVVLSVLFWPVAALIRRRYSRPLFGNTLDRVLYVFTRLLCLLQVVFLLLIVLPLSMADKNIAFIGDGFDPWLNTAHALGWIVVAGFVVIAFSVVRWWRAPGLGWWARVHPTLLLIASGFLISFAWWSHLLTPSLKF